MRRIIGVLVSVVGNIAPKGLKAPVKVWVSGYAPSHRADLFAKMSKFWAGWFGVQTWESIEGELKLRCSRDSFGHIFIRAELRSGFSPHDWSAAAKITTETGQLDKSGVNAELFFGRESWAIYAAPIRCHVAGSRSVALRLLVFSRAAKIDHWSVHLCSAGQRP
jgi:hypothetical protein